MISMFRIMFKYFLTKVTNFTISAGNGYIEGEELDLFLKEFVTSVCATDNQQVTYSAFSIF